MIPKTLFILFASTVTIYSQSRVDSYLHPKVFQTYLQTPVLLPASSLENFTNSGLSFQTEKGDLHLGQQLSSAMSLLKENIKPIKNGISLMLRLLTMG